jgi:hypothetical protein
VTRRAVVDTVAELTTADALGARMASLLLRDSGAGIVRPPDVAGVVTWFGAMQAQDHASGMWSLGARLPGFTALDVQAALERREAVRTWPMRGTVHLVPSRDARWMVEVLGRRALAGATARRAGDRAGWQRGVPGDHRARRPGDRDLEAIGGTGADRRAGHPTGHRPGYGPQADRARIRFLRPVPRRPVAGHLGLTGYPGECRPCSVAARVGSVTHDRC